MPLPLISHPTKYTSIGVFENNGANDVFQIVGPDGAVQVHMNNDGTIDPPLYLQTQFVTITSAQLLALHTTPVILIPAPVASGLIISPQYYTAIYNAGSTPYSGTTSNGLFEFGWGDTTTDINTNIVGDAFDAGFVDQATSQILLSGLGTPGGLPLSSVVNKNISIYLNTDTLTLGNGTLDFVISYLIIQS